MRGKFSRIIEDVENWPGTGENSIEAVEILRGDRIEFVVMTTRALDGEAQECFPECFDLPVDHRNFFTLHVDGRGVAFDHPVPCGSKARFVEFQSAVPSRLEQITGDLFLDKTIVGEIRIECPNEIVAIPPGVWIKVVMFGTVRLCIANKIHPMTGPAFTKCGGGK